MGFTTSVCGRKGRNTLKTPFDIKQHHIKRSNTSLGLEAHCSGTPISLPGRSMHGTFMNLAECKRLYFKHLWKLRPPGRDAKMFLQDNNSLHGIILRISSRDSASEAPFADQTSKVQDSAHHASPCGTLICCRLYSKKQPTHAQNKHYIINIL